MSEPPALGPVLLLGGGRMGGALLTGWLERGLAPSVLVDPDGSARRFASDRVRVVAAAGEVPADFAPAAIVAAVKPQVAEAVLPAYAPLAARAVTLSIMAGRTLGFLAARLGPAAALVRAMPNTPAAIRQGITVACAGRGVAVGQRALCEALLGAVGEVAWVEDEPLLDAVTAVSGSGPAYVFLLAELLERAALAEGLPADLARRLARRTVAGAGALLAAAPEDAAELRRAVTSPNGTTERALAVLMRPEAWPRLVAEAVAAAAARSRELGG